MLDFFQYHQGGKQFVGPDLGPNCLQRLSADDKLPLAGKELNTNYSLANTLAKVNFIWLQLFPFGY